MNVTSQRYIVPRSLDRLALPILLVLVVGAVADTIASRVLGLDLGSTAPLLFALAGGCFVAQGRSVQSGGSTPLTRAIRFVVRTLPIAALLLAATLFGFSAWSSWADSVQLTSPFGRFHFMGLPLWPQILIVLTFLHPARTIIGGRYKTAGKTVTHTWPKEPCK